MQVTSNRLGSPRPIRWRKGELIGAGAYGRVYMGLNLDSGELIAVKQVCIAQSSITKERAQANIRELEEEVRLLQNLSHPNIVRYLGTAREEEALNIFLEFVSGGSISSLLGKFGSFTEPVIRMYTRQLLLGLEYLHSNHIMHRDIKGANILVDNKGCIKLADFGASKKVVELATISEAKSMKGTPYWMAPEVIRQTGHNWQADMWSVGCTVIEMATGKPPWSQQFQEVAALFHIGTTKSHPPIPEHLSQHGKDFLLKLLQREPRLRPSATEMLKHPFVQNWEIQNAQDNCEGRQQVEDHAQPTYEDCSVRTSMSLRNSVQGKRRQNGVGSWRPGVSLVNGISSFAPASSYVMTGQSYLDDLNCSVRLDSVRLDSVKDSVRFDSVRNSLRQNTWSESFNPISEPLSVGGNNWRSNLTRDGGFSAIPALRDSSEDFGTQEPEQSLGKRGWSLQQEDEDEVTESKIRAFLDDKALELRKLQTPLYEEFNDSLRASASEGNTTIKGPAESFIAPLSPAIAKQSNGNTSRSPCKVSSVSGRSLGVHSSQESETSVSSGSPSRIGVSSRSIDFTPLLEIPPPRVNEWKGLLPDTEPSPSPSLSSSERQRLWKEELQRELQIKREEKRKTSQRATTTSPSPNSRLQRSARSQIDTVPQI